MAGVVVVIFFVGKNAVAVAVVVLCCVALFGAVQCGTGCRVPALSSTGLGDAIQGRARREACWGIIIQVLELGSMSWWLPGRRGGVDLRVNIAILRLSARERDGREKDLQAEMETWERSSCLVVVGFGLCWIKHAPNAGTRQSIQPKRSESNVDGRPELRGCVCDYELNGEGTSVGGGREQREQVRVGVRSHPVPCHWARPPALDALGLLRQLRPGSCPAGAQLPLRNGRWGQSSPTIGTPLPVCRPTPA